MRCSASMVLLLCALGLAGCDCDGPTEPECVDDTGCSSGQLCRDGMCVDRADGGAIPDGGADLDAATCPASQVCRGATMCCGEGEECVDGFQCLPTCGTVRCGDNMMLCCDAAEICLDGVVCAASCEAGETLCGADFDLCCPGGDVCLDDACVTPGIECTDDFDCLDAALYCEPTIGRCLTTPSDVMCEVAPTFERVELREEWHWAGVEIGGSLWENVMNTPIVGDVSGDTIPDVIVPVYRGSSVGNPILVGLSGADGTLLFAIERSDPSSSAEIEGVAVADFDPSDAALEFVYRLDGGGIRMMDGDGVTEIALRLGVNARGTIEVADFNHDGVPDVVVGCRVFDGRDISDATRDIIAAGSCPSGGWEAPAIA
ncbi:MAG TPA: hypothetical protein ENK57_20840, partial [Polyangiaceae bacterium]|nr:hypothetical protein [Polyangiaceae bacterium]